MSQQSQWAVGNRYGAIYYSGLKYKVRSTKYK